jgi:endonuclease YncB( thermonuclease family)
VRAAIGSAAVLLVAGAVGLIASSSDLFGGAPKASGQLGAAPAAVSVIDAGTLRLDRQVVRLAGVEPPPRGESCGRAGDCGAAAANALAVLVREAPVSCTLHGIDAMGRPLAVCAASGVELNRAVIAAGWARADGGRPELRQAEAAARTDRRGLWASP